MDGMHSIDKTDLFNKIESEINTEGAKVKHNSRVYVVLKEDGGFDVSIGTNKPKGDQYVKVPNRLVREFIQENKTNLSLKDKKIEKWEASLKMTRIGKFFHKKVEEDGYKDFQTAVKNNPLNRTISSVAADNAKVFSGADELKEEFASEIEEINNGGLDQYQIADFLVNVIQYNDDNKLSFENEIQKEVVDGYTREGDFDIKDQGYFALTREARKLVFEDDSFSEENSSEVSEEVSPEIETIVNALNNGNDNGLNLILSALGIDVENLRFDEFM